MERSPEGSITLDMGQGAHPKGVVTTSYSVVATTLGFSQKAEVHDGCNLYTIPNQQ
jgi:hypothetical protein